ncbi:MAG: hypothetical protein LH702_31840 [Phormidesmis sp. CAN_BIN44]|nr:hypothetical protein [Phormidesmis sp. CAN_BIN44]
MILQNLRIDPAETFRWNVSNPSGKRGISNTNSILNLTGHGTIDETFHRNVSTVLGKSILDRPHESI